MERYEKLNYSCSGNASCVFMRYPCGLRYGSYFYHLCYKYGTCALYLSIAPRPKGTKTTAISLERMHILLYGILLSL